MFGDGFASCVRPTNGQAPMAVKNIDIRAGGKNIDTLFTFLLSFRASGQDGTKRFSSRVVEIDEGYCFHPEYSPGGEHRESWISSSSSSATLSTSSMPGFFCCSFFADWACRFRKKLLCWPEDFWFSWGSSVSIPRWRSYS